MKPTSFSGEPLIFSSEHVKLLAAPKERQHEMRWLKEKWKIESNLQMTIIFIVFAITGSTTVKITTPLLNLIGISKQDTHLGLYWIVSVLFSLVVYQLLLISIGTLFGQFAFFWKFEQKMLKRFGIKFNESKPEAEEKEPV